MARPSKYTEATAAEFCKRLAQGRTLRSICGDKDMPGAQTIYNWMNAYPEFLEQYARAKEVHADAIADECFLIADTADADNVCDEYGNIKPNHEWIQRSKLRIDTRKWYLSKIMPKKYGEKIEQTVKADLNHNVNFKDVSEMSDAELDGFIKDA